MGSSSNRSLPPARRLDSEAKAKKQTAAVVADECAEGKCAGMVAYAKRKHETPVMGCELPHQRDGIVYELRPRHRFRDPKEEKAQPGRVYVGHTQRKATRLREHRWAPTAGSRQLITGGGRDSFEMVVISKWTRTMDRRSFRLFMEQREQNRINEHHGRCLNRRNSKGRYRDDAETQAWWWRVNEQLGRRQAAGAVAVQERNRESSRQYSASSKGKERRRRYREGGGVH